MRYNDFTLLPEHAFRLLGRHMTLEGGGSTPPPPDYTPVANASAESAKLGAELGHAQLDESRRQYDANTAIAQPIVKAQTDLMNQSVAQGNDYYDYMKTQQRPVEQALNAESMTDGSPAQQQEYADKAIADSRVGQTGALNTAIRQGLRYGYSPEKMAAAASAQAGTMASNEAAAANAGRMQSRNLGWARKLDVAGLYRNLPGASTAAYSVANQSGNSAVNNQASAGQTYQAGMAAGNGTIMQGQGQKVAGLGSILNAQTGIFDSQSASNASARSGMFGMVGTGVGAAAGIYAAVAI